jgi:uncharacterized protein (DUF58 family)
MAPRRHRPFPLVARRRLQALAPGAQRSRLRGAGSEIAGTRPYRPGDRLATIDWAASARLATARGEDLFVVREHTADVAVRAVVVTGGNAGLAAPGPPWLDKPAALAEAAAAIATSVEAAHGSVGFLDGTRLRAAPRPAARASGGLERSLGYLRRARLDAPAGTFVFVCSDFLPAPDAALWRLALAQGWDVVPVVAQDPVWERSFPAVGPLLLPIADPADGRVRGIRVSRRRAAELRRENERRFERLLSGFAALRLDPVVLASAEPREVDAAFGAWAAARRVAVRAAR